MNYGCRVSMEERHFIVYKHTSPSGKVYIGITSLQINNRWREGKGYKSNTHFYNAINKYGWNNFKHEILFTGLTEKEACIKEIELISKYNSTNTKKGYNVSIGGNCPSERHRKSISEKLKERWQNDDYRRYMSFISKNNKAFLGRQHSEQYRNYMSIIQKGSNNTFFGKQHTVESKQKMSEKHKGANNARAKKCICLTTLEVFEYLKQASEKYNINKSSITATCKGKRKSAGKHPITNEPLKWMYYEEYLKIQGELIC